jgi:imidazolonepropionase-like amidohydrolase
MLRSVRLALLSGGLHVGLAPFAWGVQGDAPPPALAPYVRVNARTVAIEHVRLIDGTGKPALADQTVVLTGGTIAAVGDSGSVRPPEGAAIVDGRERTLLPGYVGTHNHLFTGQFGRVLVWREMPFSFPRLYLAAGTTTLRTTGSMDMLTDLHLKSQIDGGSAIGPTIELTSPFLTGPGNRDPQMHELRGADDARATVVYWAERGVTSFKVYMHISSEALRAVIEEAHRRGLKVLGHVCSIGFREAIAAGIDELEHGILEDSDFVPGRRRNECPPDWQFAMLLRVDMNGDEVGWLIQELVANRVVISSTLPVYESAAASPASDASFEKALELLAPGPRESVSRIRQNLRDSKTPWAALLLKEMQFERRFAQAGGLLTTGPDPSGYGAVIAGVGDWRCLELLVDAGFSPVEAVAIATANGARALGQLDRIGTIEPGKAADLILVRGDPSTHIADIENVETVFKNGIGFDSKKLIDSVRGIVGLQ